MIQITDKHNCCGCEACVQICPKRCISFTSDNEGFSYPMADEAVCIDCGLCEKVCPVLQPYEERTPLNTLAAINKNEEVRMASSSGGLFTLLAEQVIDEGGVVFGARFDDKWQVVFDSAETKEEIKAFRGSKYLQAKVGTSYARCKQYLEEGRKVLFSGTQCQIAGLIHFLRKPYNNLLTVDFICHGVPSPLVWKRYLDDVLNVGNRTINDIQFRKKELGWKHFSFALEYNDNNKSLLIFSPFSKDIFMRAFLSNLILRPSCYACPAKCGKSHSDITIADFWGIDSVNPGMDDDKGTSLVLVNSEKGTEALPLGMMKFTEEKLVDAITWNPSWQKAVKPHIRRAEFFDRLSINKSISSQITYALRPTLRQRLSIFVHPRALATYLINCLKRGGKKYLILNRPGNHYDDVNHKRQITSISFRSKQSGWKNYHLLIELS